MGLFSRGPQNYPMLPDIYSDYLKQQALQERAKKSTSPSKAKPGGSKRGGAKMKPSIPGFSKKAAEAAKSVPDKYKGAYRKLFDQINDIYVKHADELNPKNGPDDNIPGVYNPGLAAKVALMEQNLIQFVNYTKSQGEAMDKVMDKFNDVDDFGNKIYSVDDMMKIPKKLTKEIWDQYYDPNSEDPEGSIRFLYEGQELALNQEAINNGAIGFEKYMINPKTGALITKGGKDAVAMKFGKPMFHDKTVFEMEYEKEIIDDNFNFDPETFEIVYTQTNADGMPVSIGYEQFLPDYAAHEHWLVKVPENNTDVINQIATGLRMNNYVQPSPDNANLKYVPPENKTKIRRQVQHNITFTENDNHRKAHLAREQTAVLLASLMYGNNEPTESLVEEWRFNMQKNNPLTEEDYSMLIESQFLGNNGMSNYDGKKVETWGDLMEEMVLRQFMNRHDDVQWTYNAASTKPAVAKATPGNVLYIDRYNGYTNGQLNNYQYQDELGPYNYTSDYYQRLTRNFKADNIGFRKDWISYDGIDPNLLHGEVGNFSSSSIENVVINTQTGKPARGTWENGRFRYHNQEAKGNLKVVPMFTGYFQFKDPNALKGVQNWANSNQKQITDFGSWVDNANNVDKGIMIHAPISGTAPNQYIEPNNIDGSENPNNSFYNMFERSDVMNNSDDVFYYDDGITKQNDKAGHSWGGVGNQGNNPIVSGTDANPSEIENDAANASQVVEETEYGSFMQEYYPDETNSMTVDFDDSDDDEDDENENEQNN